MRKEIEEPIKFFVILFMIGGISIGGTRAPWPHSGYVYAVACLKHEFKLLAVVPS